MRWVIVIAMLASCDAVFLPEENTVAIGGVPFGTPEPVPGINTTAEEDRPTLTDDLLELYFHRGTALYVAKRASALDPFGPASRIDELVSGESRRGCISGDGLRLYFSRKAMSTDDHDLFLATRTSRSATWSAAPLGDLATRLMDGDELCGSEGLGGTLLFSTDFYGDDDIVRWTPDDVDPVTRIAALNTGDNEGPPWANRDETILVFERGDGGDVHIVQATFEGAQYVTRVVVELDINGAAGSPWLSKDGRLIVYAYNNDIYMATR